MSSIGYSPGIGSGRVVETGAVRGVGASVPAPPPPTPGVSAPPAPVAVTALDAGAAPVDQDRVAMIKKAIDSDSYPLVPTKIGDAMIAAGMLLRMPK